MLPTGYCLDYHLRSGIIQARLTWKTPYSRTGSIRVSLGIRINPEKWDGRRCISNTSHGNRRVPSWAINSHLNKIEEEVARFFYEINVSGGTVNKTRLREILQDKGIPSDRTAIKSLLLQFLREGEKLRGWAFNTIKMFNSLPRLIENYHPEAVVSDITADFVNGFCLYLQSVKSAGAKEGYTNNTIRAHMRRFKWFCKWLISKGLLKKDILSAFNMKIKVVKNPIIYLDKEEIHRIEALELEPWSSMDKSRDILMFCCYTSLRIGDALKLEKSDLFGDSIEVVSEKTERRLRIELQPKAIAIIRKYDVFEDRIDTLLPYINLAQMNESLKKIGKLAGIDRPIKSVKFYGGNRIEEIKPKYMYLSSHVGRRSFIVNALSAGIPPNVVMSWTGHSEYSAMLPYIDIASKAKKSGMQMLSDYLSD